MSVATDKAWDPTRNVLSLVEAAVRRLDDLRAAEATRTDDLRAMRSEYEKELSKLRWELAKKESDRIDAVCNEIRGAAALATATINASINELRINNDNRITAAERILYQTGGRDTQRVEGRMSTQWAIGIGITILNIVIACTGLLLSTMN